MPAMRKFSMFAQVQSALSSVPVGSGGPSPDGSSVSKHRRRGRGKAGLFSSPPGADPWPFPDSNPGQSGPSRPEPWSRFAVRTRGRNAGLLPAGAEAASITLAGESLRCSMALAGPPGRPARDTWRAAGSVVDERKRGEEERG